MTRKGEIAKGALLAIGVTGLVIASLVFPNLPQAFAPFLGFKKSYSQRQLNSSLRNLKRTGLVTIKNEGDQTIIRLTKEGREKVLKYKLDKMQIKPQKRWDRKFRLVIFDIPEDHKIARNVFRMKLKELGFVPLQKSVWACPYPCEDEIDFIKEIYEVGSYVRLVTAEDIDIKSDLIKRFALS